MVNERVFKIAETGQIPANDPVSNIMSQVEIKQDGEPGLWGSFKKWAGSKGGRMTLGGLGTALGVGLSGGDFRDALGYGVIGAGNTAKTMYRNEQDAKHWADREAQRNLYWQNYEAGRRLQRELQNERIEAQKEQTAAQYQNALNQLAAQYQYNQMGLDAADARAEKRLKAALSLLPENMRNQVWLKANGIDYTPMDGWHYDIMNGTPEEQQAAVEKMKNYNQLMQGLEPPLSLGDYAGIADKAGLTLDAAALNKGQAIFAEKPKNLPDDAQMINYYISKGYSPDEARQYVGALSPAEKTKEALNLSRGQALIDRGTHAANAGVDFNYGQRAANAQTGRDMYMADYKAQIAEEKANNDIMRSAILELFKNGLSDKEQKQIQAYARFNNISEDEATARLMDAIIQKQIAETEKAQKEAAVVGRPSFGELQTGVNNQTISADTANEAYGGNYFQNKPENSSFNTEQQKQLAKDKDEYRNMVSKLPELKETVKRLNELADKATFTYAGQASGAADAGIMSAFDNDFTNSEAITQDALEGGLMGGLLGTAGNMALKPLSKVFSAKELTKGKKGGLNNVVDNPDAVKIVRRGIGASDNVAQEFMNKVPAAARRINSETADMINNSLNRRIDVPRTVASQKQKYRDFMEANAGNEVLDFSELLPEVHRYRGKDNLSVLKSIRRNLQKTEPEFKFRLDEQGNYDYPHFLKDSQRQQYVHSLASTYRFPDKIVDGINDNQNRQYLLKTFYNPDNQKAVYDVGVLNSDGTLLTKFAREGRKGKTTTENILKKGIARTSTGGTTLTPSQMGAAPSLNVRLNNTINPNGLVVNPELPHYLTLYEGLTPYQVKSLNSAVKRGSEKTTNKLGTLDSMNRIKQELNDDIMKSKVPDEKNSLNLVDTSDTKQLREVKQRIDRTLGDALKGRDKGYRKAKSMDEAYNAGRRYNPNAVGNDALIPSLPPLERNAFTQGLFQRMTHNPLTGSNLANDALKYENALSGVLPPSRYDALMDGLNRQNVRYNRLAQLGGRAQNKLVMPEKDWFFGREQLESKGATLGAGLDWVNEALRGRAYEQAAKNLLDPDFVGTEGSWLMENYPTLSAYLSGMFAAE